MKPKIKELIFAKHPKIKSITVLADGVQKQLTKFDPKVLRELAIEITPVITYLFQQSLNNPKSIGL